MAHLSANCPSNDQKEGSHADDNEMAHAQQNRTPETEKDAAAPVESAQMDQVRKENSRGNAENSDQRLHLLVTARKQTRQTD